MPQIDTSPDLKVCQTLVLHRKCTKTKMQVLGTGTEANPAMCPWSDKMAVFIYFTHCGSDNRCVFSYRSDKKCKGQAILIRVDQVTGNKHISWVHLNACIYFHFHFQAAFSQFSNFKQPKFNQFTKKIEKKKPKFCLK